MSRAFGKGNQGWNLRRDVFKTSSGNHVPDSNAWAIGIPFANRGEPPGLACYSADNDEANGAKLFVWQS
jgi:hypothetical protein